MISLRFLRAVLAPLAILAMVLPSMVTAQEDPFGVPVVRPAGGPAPADGPGPTGKGEAKKASDEPAPPEPLVIELLRRSNPATPQRLLEAAQAAFRFGRPDEAKVYLAKFLADKPGDEILAAIAKNHTEFLLQLSTQADLQPEGKQTADALFAASERVLANPETIQDLIAQLSSPELTARQLALERLELAQNAAINPLLRVLADKTRAAEHPHVRSALVALSPLTEEPLIAALETSDVDLKMQVIAMLARMKSRKAAVWLLRPALDASAPPGVRELASAALKRIFGAAPDLYEAERYLRLELDRFQSGNLRKVSNPFDQVPVWQWNAAKHEVVPVTLPRRAAGDWLAARAALDLAALKPTDPEARQSMLLANLELAKMMGGLDSPLSTDPGSIGAVGLSAGPKALSSVLVDALRIGRLPAAMGAAELLGQTGDPGILRTGSSASPLAEAMLSSDRRVRLAAALAAVKLAPGDPFTGAGRIAEVLAWLVPTRGENLVLVGHPRGEDAQILVTFAQSLGFAGDAAYTGRVLTERAFANPDVAIILLSDAIDSPPVEELVQWLRRDYRTARIPIGVMARSERWQQLAESLAGDPLTTVFPRIHSLEVAEREFQRLKALAGPGWVEPQQRLHHAQVALEAMNLLASDPAAVLRYDLLRHEPVLTAALGQPSLMSPAAEILAKFGTPAAQLALVEAASQNHRPLVERQLAAASLTASIKSRGVLLTQSQIARQYDRYNSSAALDRSTQDLLGSLLDTIESAMAAAGN